jgi:hypothetical protein
MMLQSFSLSFLISISAMEDRRRPLWRRLTDAIMANQQRKAELVVRDYLRRHWGELRDDFVRELERRHLDPGR